MASGGVLERPHPHLPICPFAHLRTSCLDPAFARKYVGNVSCELDTAALLRAAGQKVTPQRMLILGCVRHAQGHVTAGQVLEDVRRSYPFIDASTVYRTLAAGKELRLVSETNLGAGDNLFEWVGAERHHHLICRSCGAVSDLDEHHLDALVTTLQRETGFHADLDHIAIFGTCRQCAGAGGLGPGAGEKPGHTR